MKTREELKAHYRNEDARGRQVIREMAEDVLSANPTSEFHLNLIGALDDLAAEGSVGRPSLKDMSDQANHRRTGGQKGANQYGEYTVRYATPGQAGYLRSLLETRDYSAKHAVVKSEIAKAARELATGKVAWRLASDVIDALKDCPVIQGAAAPATDRQVAAIQKMVPIKAGGEEKLAAKFQELGIESADDLTFDAARELMDYLVKADWKPRNTVARAEKVELEDGVYMYEGEIYAVVHAQGGSGRQYAKKLVPTEFGTAKFQYDRGTIFKLRPEHVLTREMAKQYGALYGVCARCGRTLSNDDSIERMMGPVCYRKTAA